MSCFCGDCLVCEFVAARRRRRAKAPTSRPQVRRAAPPVNPTIGDIARATGLPAREVREALRAGRAPSDLLFLAG